MTDPRPPRLGRWLLRLRPLGSRRAEIAADLHEAFVERASHVGRARAALRYYVDVLSTARRPRRSHRRSPPILIAPG